MTPFKKSLKESSISYNSPGFHTCPVCKTKDSLFVSSCTRKTIWGGCSACGRKGFSEEWTPAINGEVMDTKNSRLEFLMGLYNRKLKADFHSSGVEILFREQGSGLRHIDPACPYMGVADTVKLKKDLEWVFGSVKNLWNPYYLNNAFDKWLVFPTYGAYGMVDGLLLIRRGMRYYVKEINYNVFNPLSILSGYCPDTLYIPDTMNTALFMLFKSLEIFDGRKFADIFYHSRETCWIMERFTRPKKIIFVGMNERNKKLMVRLKNIDMRGIDLGHPKHISEMPIMDLIRNPEEVTLPPESFPLDLYSGSSRKIEIF